MSQPPTMRVLAAELGLSPATVSLALRNHPDIAEKTRIRVQEEAQARGYRVNPSLTAFMSHVRSARRAEYRETIAWINPCETADHFVNPTGGASEYARSLWKGALKRALQLGFGLDSFWTGQPGMTGKRLTKILISRGVRGLLIPPMPKSYSHLSIDWREFAVSALTYTITQNQFHRVVPDHHFNMQMIIRQLRRRGYKRIGLLISNAYDNRSENRFSSAFSFYQLTIPRQERVPPMRENVDSEVARGNWLKKYQPDAVITQGGHRKLREIDIGKPAYSSRLGVVLIGRASTDVGYAAVDENPLSIGANAVDHLSLQLVRNERGLPDTAQTVLIKGSWVDGESLVSQRAKVR